MLRAAKQFTAGQHCDDALALGERLNKEGFFCDFNYIGDHSQDPRTIAQAFETYAHLIREIQSRALRAGISPKLSQLGILGDPDSARINEAKFELLTATMAWAYSIRLTIDREELSHTKRTNRFIKKTAASGPVGSVVQACAQNAPETIDEVGTRNFWRVCKGAYTESPELILHRKRHVRDRYRSIVSNILTRGGYVQIATHDRMLIEKVIGDIGRLNVSPDTYEFAFLLGLDMKLARSLLQRGYRVTIYIPFGIDIEGYCIRRIIEKPKYILLPLKALFRAT